MARKAAKPDLRVVVDNSAVEGADPVADKGAGSPEQGWLAPWVEFAGERRFGHPVLLGRGLLGGLAGFAADRSLRDLRGSARPLLGVQVASSSILDDLDRPEDLDRLRERLARPRKSRP